MIGHYLLTLSTEAEDRILTTRMVPSSYISPRDWVIRADENGDDLRHGPIEVQVGDRCLVGAAANYRLGSGMGFVEAWLWRAHWSGDEDRDEIVVEERYDHLCYRFGVERVNRAIRARIWTNRGLRLAMLERDAEYCGQHVWVGDKGERCPECPAHESAGA